MDERRQYVPTSTRTYKASDTTIGIAPETIVREAAEKVTDYKNTTDLPIESVEGAINAKMIRDHANKL